jgi:hypothetical protein
MLRFKRVCPKENSKCRNDTCLPFRALLFWWRVMNDDADDDERQNAAATALLAALVAYS